MPENNLADALHAWRSGSRDEAERLARALIACDPNDLDPHRLLQEILASSDRVAEAIEVARRLIELSPRDAATHRRLADLLSRRGDASAAIDVLEESLEIEPGNARALNNLGQLLTREGRDEEAIEILSRTIALNPNHPAALVNLGVAYARTGSIQRAIDCYQQALALNPCLTEALVNLGGAFMRSSRPEVALAYYEQASALSPPDPRTLAGRGEALLALKRYREALASFDGALHSPPGLAAALLGRAHALLGLKRPAAALEACDSMLAQSAPPTGARGLRATALLALDRVPEAVVAASEAVAAEPSDAQAHVALGFAALRSGLSEAALSAFDAALGFAPTLAKAHAGRAHALEALGRAAEAVDAYHQAARCDPTDASVYLSSGQMMLRLGSGAGALAAFDALLALDRDHILAKEGRAKALVSLGRHEEALQALGELMHCAAPVDYLPGYHFYAQLCCCDWGGYDSIRRDIAAGVGRGERVDVPLSFLAHSREPDEQLACARIYAAAECAVPVKIARAAPADANRLRIGYLSSDFRDHPVAQLTAALFECHDRSRFETYGFCAAPDDGSNMRRRLAAAFEHFEDVSALPDGLLAEHIAALGLDILIDLGGHTSGSRTRALAYRPAPVQILFLGFPGTLGTDFVDYLIADRHVIPEADRRHYAEQVIYMPDTYLPTGFAGPQPPAPARAAAGLPDEGFVFCCFNAPFKFTPEVFGGWTRILKAVPASVLWLREASAAMKRNLEREAAERGVDPARLIWAPRVPSIDEHVARLALADVFLDTSPYNAHTTASEALAAAVPLITQRGRTFASRVATSLLHAIGLGHLSVETLADYERLAIELAQSPTGLAALKAHLRRARRSAPLFDPVRFCRHLEDAFVEVAARGRRGEPTDTLFVRRV